MPQLDASIPIHELVISTAEDLHRMYPDFVAKVVTDKVDARNIHQGLVCFYDVLKCIGDSEWIDNPKVRDNFKYDNVEQATLEELVKIEVTVLEHINRVAKAKFDSIKEEEEEQEEQEEEGREQQQEEEELNRGESPKSMCIDVSSVGHSPDWKYPPPCSSPQTPTSVLPESPCEENGNCSPFEGLKVQQMDKQSPMDWKKISFQMILQNNARNLNKGNKRDLEGGIKYQGPMVDEKNQIGGISDVEENESPTQKPKTPRQVQVLSQDSNDDIKTGQLSPRNAQARSKDVIDEKIDESSSGHAQAQSKDETDVKSGDLSPLIKIQPIETRHSPQQEPKTSSPQITPPEVASPISPPSPHNNPTHSSPRTTTPKVAPPISSLPTHNSPTRSSPGTTPKVAPPISSLPTHNSPTCLSPRTTLKVASPISLPPPHDSPTFSSPRTTTLKVAPPSSPPPTPNSSSRSSLRITTLNVEPPPSPPPTPKSLTCSIPSTPTPDVAQPPSPPPSPKSPTHSILRTTTLNIAQPQPPSPSTPPNSPTPQSSSRPLIKARPPPPPPISGSGPPPPPGGALPPPPPPPDGDKEGAKGNGSAPPPPPPRSLRAKMTTRLKRSTQMANLYRFLKGKVEGSSIPNQSSQAKKSSGNNGAAGGGQSMADALAEMTKRSAYFQQIEEDVEKHGAEIKEMQTTLSSFQTKDMEELLRFHQDVESKLEVLTDETQILSRFEDFPVKKLEALRMAAALYTKLSGILTELHNWKIESPLEQLLQKVERYFTKVKGELEPLERTKDEEAKKLKSHNIHFDFQIIVKIKESLVDVSSSCIELALKERREAMAATNDQAWSKPGGQRNICAKMLWRAFQFAFKVYSFAGGQDERADNLTRELAQEIEKDPVHV